MKQLSILFSGISLAVLIMSSCKSKNTSGATELVKDIQTTVKEHTPGTVATSETGYYMKAKIDGKEWSAAYMMPDESTSSSYKTIHGENGETYINFMLWRNGMQLDKSEAFNEENIANLSVKNVSGFWGGKKGELKITVMDDQWLEGSFYFDATSSSTPDKTIHVTEGRFRVPTQNTR